MVTAVREHSVVLAVDAGRGGERHASGSGSATAAIISHEVLGCLRHVPVKT